MEVLSIAELIPKIVDIESDALIRAIHQLPSHYSLVKENEIVAFIYTSTTKIALSVLQHGDLIDTRKKFLKPSN